MEGLFSVPAATMSPPVLEISAPSATSVPALFMEALLPTLPVMVILPALETVAPASRRTPRDTWATPLGNPASPVMLISPVPAVMLEVVTTTPAAEPPVALAPPLLRLPVMVMVPVPLVLTLECVPPLLVISTEWLALLPAALIRMLPPAELTSLPSTCKDPLGALRLTPPPAAVLPTA